MFDLRFHDFTKSLFYNQVNGEESLPRFKKRITLKLGFNKLSGMIKDVYYNRNSL